MEETQITQNKEIQELKGETEITVGVVASIEVLTEDQAFKASEFVKGINDKIKRLEEKRLTFTKPLNESLTAINNTFRELSAPLNNAKTIVTNKIMAWRRLEQEKIEKEEARRRAIQESHAEKGHNVNVPVVMEKPKATIGNVQVRKIWKYKIEDFSKIPDSYKTIDPNMVNIAIRGGIKDIPGLKIYQEEISAIR